MSFATIQLRKDDRQACNFSFPLTADLFNSPEEEIACNIFPPCELDKGNK